MVAAKVTHQPDTVRIVAKQTVLAHHQGVHRTGGMRTITQRTGQPERPFLERHGDVEATTAAGDKLLDIVFKFLEVAQNTVVAHVLTGLARKLGVDLRRFRMRYRVADHGIQVCHLFAVVLASV